MKSPAFLPGRRSALSVALLATALLAGVVTASSGAKPPAPWQEVGKKAKIDLPAGFGVFEDVDKHRAGVQVVASVLSDPEAQRLRFVSEEDVLIGESADGGFEPQDSLAAGWRAFAIGTDPTGRARLWRPAFDAARTLVALDPALPCNEATDPATALAGPFDVTIPAGATPGGETLPAATSALVYPGGGKKEEHGLRIETGAGIELAHSKHKHDLPRGGFAFGGAIFAYGTSKDEPTLWTPELDGKSTKLADARFAACTDAAPLPPLEGGLSGPPAGAALDAIEDTFTPGAYVLPGELTGSLVRTQVELAFRRDATVGEVNDLLRRIDGRIVSAREGVLIAVVRIPDPGSVEALEQLLDELSAHPVVRIANRTLIPETAVLPAIIDAGTSEVQFVRHHLAVRAHAAWNARAALGAATTTVPTLVVGDAFGAGPPGSFFDVLAAASDFANGAPAQHGYHVLGITTATFEGVGGDAAADAVTGMFPGTLPLEAVDIKLQIAGATLDDRMLEAVENAPGNVVLNTSLQFPCETLAEAVVNCTDAAANAAGVFWVERVRGTNPAYSLEGKFFHAAAAGNLGVGVGPLGAALSSEGGAAALLSLTDPATGDPVANTTNALVTENFSAGSSEPFRPGCLAPSSEPRGTIAAIGESVHSYGSPTTTVTLGGTSMATPQLAGLAAYVWALRPGLSPAQLAALLRRTAQPTPGCGNGLVIDAYAAVLAADEGAPLRPARRAILDAADGSGDPGSNSFFDELDLDLFLSKVDPAFGAIDYGRYDLNGDGVTGTPTGEAGSARVDLDLNGSYSLVSQSVEGVSVRFDEKTSSDLKVLCHSAYSSLYSGSEAARRERLGLERCLRLDLETQFPATVDPDVSNLLTVRLTDRDLPDPATAGAFLGQQGLRIELTPTGGTVDSFAGTTNADGIFQTNARLFAGQPELAIEIVVRAREGGPELMRKTVRVQDDAAVPAGTYVGTRCLFDPLSPDDGCRPEPNPLQIVVTRLESGVVRLEYHVLPFPNFGDDIFEVTVNGTSFTGRAVRWDLCFGDPPFQSCFVRDTGHPISGTITSARISGRIDRVSVRDGGHELFEAQR